MLMLNLDGIDYVGIHCHSGTQFSDGPYFMVRLFKVDQHILIINCSSASRINTNNNDNINQNYSTSWQLHNYMFYPTEQQYLQIYQWLAVNKWRKRLQLIFA